MKNWLKYVAVLLLAYVHIGGLLFAVPRKPILNETIRALYFHVPMWFGMVALFSVSVYYSILYLRNSGGDRPLDAGGTLDLAGVSRAAQDDHKAVEYANVGLVFGILGMITGMLWANYTWGSPWNGDPKQNGAAIALLVYLAYFILRGSVDDDEKKARLSAVYNIFAFAAMVPLIFIIPRLTDSMHPGNGGNPGFNAYDLDSRMRAVFYPAVIAWILIGIWIVSIRIKMRSLEEKIHELEHGKMF